MALLGGVAWRGWADAVWYCRSHTCNPYCLRDLLRFVGDPLPLDPLPTPRLDLVSERHRFCIQFVTGTLSANVGIVCPHRW